MPGACQPWKVRRASHPAEGPRAVAVLPPGDVLLVLTSVGLASFELAAKPCSLVPDQGEMGEKPHHLFRTVPWSLGRQVQLVRGSVRLLLLGEEQRLGPLRVVGTAGPWGGAGEKQRGL